MFENRDLFEGLGEIKDLTYEIESIEPARKVPIHLQAIFKAELEKMKKLGVIK